MIWVSGFLLIFLGFWDEFSGMGLWLEFEDEDDAGWMMAVYLFLLFVFIDFCFLSCFYYLI